MSRRPRARFHAVARFARRVAPCIRPRFAPSVAFVIALSGCDVGDGTRLPPPSVERPDNLPDVARASPFADLSLDTLVAPAAPILDIRAVPGALVLAWSPAPPGTRRTRLIAHDRGDGRESVLVDAEPGHREHHLPVAAHRLRADASSWRVEHCGDTGCVSSRRRSATGLVAATFEPVEPGVAVVGERFGERVALDASGSLLAVTRPVSGRIGLYHAQAGGLFAGDALAAFDHDRTAARTLDVALSASGDTVAVLGIDGTAGREARVIVFERLGEGWLESARFAAFPDELTSDETLADDASTDRRVADDFSRGEADGARPRVLLSTDGTRLLATCTGVPACPLVVHELGTSGWRRVATPGAPDPAALGAASSPGELRAVAAAGSLDRIAVVAVAAEGVDGGAPVLHVHERAAGRWTSDAVALPALAADAPIAIALERTGDRVAIGGLEASRDRRAAPVLWRHRLARTDDALALETEDSLRLPPPGDAPVRTVSLVADASLDTIAFGWTTAHDAALVTRVRRADAWVPALSLPEAAGHFAKRRFGAALALAADGSTLALDLPDASVDRPTAPRAGRVLLMRARGAGSTHPPSP